MAIKSQFDIPKDCIIFTTKTNGDYITIKNVHLGQESATNLANLINSGETLTATIKKVGEE